MTERLDRIEAIVEANTRAIADFQAGMSELRESQALLVQMFAQEQDALREFRRVTNAALDRMERNQIEANRRMDAHERRMDAMQQQTEFDRAQSNRRMDAMQQQTEFDRAQSNRRIEAIEHQINGVLELLRGRFDERNGG